MSSRRAPHEHVGARARNPSNGDVTHPSMIYVVRPEGRLAYALGADSDTVTVAVEALRASGRS